MVKTSQLPDYQKSTAMFIKEYFDVWNDGFYKKSCGKLIIIDIKKEE